jgi:hypothetical protein
VPIAKLVSTNLSSVPITTTKSKRTDAIDEDKYVDDDNDGVADNSRKGRGSADDDDDDAGLRESSTGANAGGGEPSSKKRKNSEVERCACARTRVWRVTTARQCVRVGRGAVGSHTERPQHALLPARRGALHRRRAQGVHGGRERRAVERLRDDRVAVGDADARQGDRHRAQAQTQARSSAVDLRRLRGIAAGERRVSRVVWSEVAQSKRSNRRDTRITRSKSCIVCSHITRQRETAQAKLDKSALEKSANNLRRRIADRYDSYRFQRQLTGTYISPCTGV